MKKLFFLCSFMGLMACQEEVKTEDKTENTFETVVIKNGKYTEFYPETNIKKIEGGLDKDSLRHGRWDFFDTQGKKLSFTLYKHGKKHGHSYIAYPNGAPYYYGEYIEDTMVGVWKYFDENGVKTEKDYGYPEAY